MSQTKKYWYPQVQVDEMVETLISWGLSVSHEQLARPSSDFVTGIYVACLERMTLIDQSALQEPLQNALASLDDSNTDLYSASLSQNFILYHLNRFARACKVNDFSLRDLHYPQTARTCDILSAFINFIKFTEQRENLVLGLQKQSDTVLEERESVKAELETLQKKIVDIRLERAQDEPTCDKLQKENADITARLMATRDVQAALLKDIDELKIQKAQVQQKKENMNKDTNLASDGISRTRSRIVQSPERIKRNISTMSATAIEDKKTVAMLEGKARDLQAKINVLLVIEKDVRASVEQLQQFERIETSLEASLKDVSDLKDHLQDRRADRSNLRMKQERTSKQISIAEEKLQRTNRHAEEKRAANAQTIARLQREYEELVMERRENDKELESLRLEAEDIAKKMTEHMKASEAELNALLTPYWELRYQTECYMETLGNKLGMRVSMK